MSTFTKASELPIETPVAKKPARKTAAKSSKKTVTTPVVEVSSPVAVEAAETVTTSVAVEAAEPVTTPVLKTNAIKPSFQQIVYMSGLPRCGSTLLSAILSQNPAIHAEGNSAVCQLMWDMYVSTTQNCGEQLRANDRERTVYDLVSSIPHIYYKDISANIVVDKCRSWSMLPNIQILQNFVGTDIKMIILERPMLEIAKSFAKLYKANEIYEDEKMNALLTPNTEPVMRSFNGLKYAKHNNEKGQFLFISYEDLVKNTVETLHKIYEFCGWEWFEHNLTNIVNKYPENDVVYGLKGMHEVRPVVSMKENSVKLSEKLIAQCLELDTEK
jgi:sulfotransferase